ncbi:MAG: Uncharacterised protein [Bacteroidota bacterium]|nr:MAG: Uncharacterised protein [Bacteroidota bacterium]
MDKLYTLLSSKNTPAPTLETLQFIIQFASAYEPISVGSTTADFIAN